MNAPTKFTCPNGHAIEAHEHETVCCDECDLVATWLNHRTGEVFAWTQRDEYEEGCRRLQDAMDEAFDHQYFDEW